MSLTGWENFACKCGSNAFVAIVKLGWKQGSGMTPQPNGWACAKCGIEADIELMVKNIRIGQREREIDELRNAG